MQKKAYLSKHKKTHKSMKVGDSGLVISNSHPWVAVSPDLIAQCDCHGRRIVEIKCPESIKNENPYIKRL